MIKRTALAAALILLVALVALTGCRSAPETNDEPTQPRRARVAEMPSPEELGDNPCGNPSWAKLPPGVGEFSADTDDTVDAVDADADVDEEPAEQE